MTVKRRAFTLIEMLTTVAVLVIVLGLMVSLARDVRTRSADRLTKDLLRRLDGLMIQYKSKLPKTMPEAKRQLYPIVRPLLDSEATVDDENRLRNNALANNRELVRALKSQTDLSGGAFNDLSIASFNEVNVLDAWGSPIVFMPHQHPLIGMAAGDAYFFFSAGPDRNYLTRQDNLYSYEGPAPNTPIEPPATGPTTAPASGQ
jgi:prepilin-type N-terminal cleavage/methylation domain-containing protein